MKPLLATAALCSLSFLFGLPCALFLAAGVLARYSAAQLPLDLEP